MNRWFHIAGLVWMATLVGILAFGVPMPLFLGAGALVFLGWFVFWRRKLPLWVFSAAVAVCFSSLYFTVYEWAALRPPKAFEGETYAVRGVVTDRDRFGNGAQLSFRLERGELPKGLGGAKVRVWVPSGIEANIGDRLEYTLTLACPPNRRAALYADGFRFESAAYYQPRVVGQASSLEIIMADYRAQIRAQLVSLLPGGEGELLAAMLTGKTGGIPPETREAYARAGISHLLAVSGLHLAVLTTLLGSILRLFALSRRRQAMAEMLAVLLFMALTGFAHSVMRAGLMLLLSRMALLLGRDADTLNSLGAAVVLILLLNPYAALDVGMQLSYLATMGIAAFAEPMTQACVDLLQKLPPRKGRKPYRVTAAVAATACVTCAASLLTTPLLCWYFGQLSLVSIVVNIVVMPFTTIALTTGLLCAALSFMAFLGPVSDALGLAAGLAVRVIDRTAVFFASWKYAAVSVREGYQLIWMVVTLVLLFFLYYRRSPWQLFVWAAELSACVLLVGAFSNLALQRYSLELAAVRTGEAVAIRYAQQAAVVGAPSGLYELGQLQRFLKDSKVDSISLLVIDRSEQQFLTATQQFYRQFEVEKTVVLEEVAGFEAELFGGRVRVFSQKPQERAVWIEAGDFLMVKDFLMRPQPADLLINARNELVTAPALGLRPVERYYGAAVLAFSTLHSASDGKEGG